MIAPAPRPFEHLTDAELAELIEQPAYLINHHDDLPAESERRLAQLRRAR